MQLLSKYTLKEIFVFYNFFAENLQIPISSKNK